MQLGESWSSGLKEQVGVLPPSCVAQLTAGVENKPSSLLEYLTQFRLGKRLTNLPLKSFLFWCEGRGAPVPTSPTTPHSNSGAFWQYWELHLSRACQQDNGVPRVMTAEKWGVLLMEESWRAGGSRAFGPRLPSLPCPLSPESWAAWHNLWAFLFA